MHSVMYSLMDMTSFGSVMQKRNSGSFGTLATSLLQLLLLLTPTPHMESFPRHHLQHCLTLPMLSLSKWPRAHQGTFSTISASVNRAGKQLRAILRQTAAH